MNVRFLTCPYCFSSVPGGSCCWGSVGSFQAVTVTSTCQETGSHRHGLRMEFFTRGRGSRREAASDWNGRGRLVFCRVAMDSGHRQDVLLHCASPNWKFPEKFPSELRAARRKRQPMPGSRKGRRSSQVEWCHSPKLPTRDRFSNVSSGPRTPAAWPQAAFPSVIREQVL